MVDFIVSELFLSKYDVKLKMTSHLWPWFDNNLLGLLLKSGHVLKIHSPYSELKPYLYLNLHTQSHQKN